MTPESYTPRRPYEIFGFSEEEVNRLRIPDEKLQEILANPNTNIHSINASTNTFGEFMFLRTSKGMGQNRIRMTFYGLGYHQYRERWLYEEWFWYQSQGDMGGQREPMSLEDAQRQLEKRRNALSPFFYEYEQSEYGWMFERMADMTDDDAALAEMQDLGLL